MPPSVSRFPFATPFLVVLLLILLPPSPSEAQRLPQTVRPEHYSLTLTPDLKTATFSGRESIEVEIEQPVGAITLNAAEIHFESVTASIHGKTVAAKVSEDAEKQQATLDFGRKLPQGKLTLEIRYTGILNNKLRGFYLSKTSKRNYAVTQFESTDARRAFPSFDEPALKATFSVTLVVDKDDTAISNTNIVEDKPLANDKHAIVFATTPKMSTYLVAFLVGDFQCLSGSSDGVPIRVCATPDQVQYGAFALEAAEYVLHYYNTYFGIPYPLPKLDMIAIPDFEAGAMENFGAITYRESDLLLDPSRASVGAQRRVGLVVAHEMAHQWFGDMVTLKWWDNTWLNEGFATWMEAKPLEAWKPEWQMDEEVANDLQATLNLDAQRVTHAIRAKADTPDEINEMFDGISYGKGGAVLLMIENYLGAETFRQGVHRYLAAHLYGNATAEDFWTTQSEVSRKPVDTIMDSLISQPGVPMLSFGHADGSSVPVTQERFFLNSKVQAERAEHWTLPVCLKAVGGQRCEVLSAARGSLAVPPAPFLFANADGKGYYLSSYTAGAYRELVTHVETDLTPSERISLLGDQWALMVAGKSAVGSYLDIVSAVRNDSDAEVLASVISNRSAATPATLNTIDAQIAATAEERNQLSAWVRASFGPAYKSLGVPGAKEAPEKRELRAQLLTLVAGLGKDPDAVAEAKSIAARSLADPASVDSTLAVAALDIAAVHGDQAIFDRLQKASKEAVDAQDRATALRALARFADPVLTKRALDYAVSGEVRNQDASGFLAVELRNLETREVAWQFIQDNWDKVNEQLTTFGGATLVGGVSGFCTAERLNQVTDFFATHKVAASAQALARAKDQINDCIHLRAAQEGNLAAWLSQQ